MKLNLPVAILATAALASASPIRLIVVSSTTTNVEEGGQIAPHPAFRFGRPVAAIEDFSRVHPPHFPTHGPPGGRPCAGRMSAWRKKAIAISNSFRSALGWPLIEVNAQPIHHHPHHHHSHDQPPRFATLRYDPNHREHDYDYVKAKILPFIGTPPSFIAGGPGRENVPEGHWHHGPHHHVSSFGRLRPVDGRQSFMTRLHYSLLNLGTWEGRAVAFVLGLGIGVLLRMFWVLTVVFIRSIRGSSSSNNDDGYTAIAFVEHIEDEEHNQASPPPTYVYPVDEKIKLEEDAAKVPLPPSPAPVPPVEADAAKPN